MIVACQFMARNLSNNGIRPEGYGVRVMLRFAFRSFESGRSLALHDPLAKMVHLAATPLHTVPKPDRGNDKISTATAILNPFIRYPLPFETGTWLIAMLRRTRKTPNSRAAI